MNQQTENKCTFWEVLNHKVNSISVPVIQRDYAQGRTTKKVEQVRTKFLDALAGALRDNVPLCLDFVYGAQKSHEVVELIDGQQRFTTLYLLHVYFAIKENVSQENRQVFRKLLYQVRSSTQAFCENLPGFCGTLDNDIIQKPTSKEKKEKKGESDESDRYHRLSHDIRNSLWFSSQWLQDPTVCGMLHMLDEIHNHPYFGTQTNLFSKLTGEDCPITFHFLNIEEFGDSEDLYIKMNSRGKALTDFENFKALFGKRLQQLGERDPRLKDLAPRFWENIDGDWSQVFWDFILNKYIEAEDLPEERYIYRVDSTMLSYLWLQVAMITWAINRDIPSSRADEDIPECFKDNRPDMDFTLIDHSGTTSTGQLKDWNENKIGELTPETMMVRSLEKANEILPLMKELFDCPDAPVPLWNNGGTVDAICPVEVASESAANDTKLLNVKENDKAYLEKVLGFTVLYWCCAFGVPQPDSPGKSRLIGYLRALRNSLSRYRARKKDSWDTELDKKNINKIVDSIVNVFLNNAVDCDTHLLEGEKAASLSKHFDEEKDKATYRQADRSIDEQLRIMEDHDICKGTVSIFLEDGRPFVSPEHFRELLEQIKQEPLLLSRALLACGDDKENYFRILAGEGDNWNRVKFGGGKATTWAQGLQNEQTIQSNRIVLKRLVDKYAKNREMGNACQEALKKIADAFIQDCEDNNVFGWRYYMVKYADLFFGEKKVIYFVQKKQSMPFMPLMHFNPENPFGCESAQRMRFRNDASVNSFILCAVCKWFDQQNRPLDETFSAGANATLQKEGRTISLRFESNTFFVNDVAIPVTEKQDVIEQIVAEIDRA